MRRARDIRRFLDEDVGRGDVTSDRVVPPDARARGRIVAKQDAVVAGLAEAAEVFGALGVRFDPAARDGGRVTAGAAVAAVEGNARAILKGERVALNIIQRMSGIATMTRRVVEAGRSVNPRLVVAATRKTTPGFRAYEKRAVEVGGGDAHRHGLDDMVLVKDNHIRVAGGLEAAMDALFHRAASGGGRPLAHKVEVEVSSLEDALSACRLGAEIVMLDNMPLEDLETTSRSVKGAFPAVVVEVSGNITAENVGRVAAFADVVSVGALTHSAPACDFHLKVEPIR
ncbi:MAG TPA: carboxylating nicotinate-nucleotide diphosphorylase [Candidatus Thermoplasmatota archaeon]